MNDYNERPEAVLTQAGFAERLAFWLEDTSDLDVLDALATAGLKLVSDPAGVVSETYQWLMLSRMEDRSGDEGGTRGAGQEAGGEGQAAREEGGGLRLV